MTPRHITGVLFLLLTSVACQRDVSVPAVANGVTPFAELAGVHLGMRAAELTSLRPEVVTASYYGFQETLGSVEVSYEVPGSVQDGQPPPPSASLQSVIVSRVLDTAAAPSAQWHREVRRVAAAVGAEPSCHQLRWPTATAWLAIWSRGNADLFVLGQPTVDEGRGASTPATIRIGVTRSGQAAARFHGIASARMCTDMFAQAG